MLAGVYDPALLLSQGCYGNSAAKQEHNVASRKGYNKDLSYSLSASLAAHARTISVPAWRKPEFDAGTPGANIKEKTRMG
jgi:hypothetical protein